jgi:AcrR family transcriptional regulator
MEREAGKARRAPRSDSIRNRARLIAAARDVFSAGGPEASLEAVARAAGVGIGTLYRHFPTREALFQTVYLHEVDQLVALAEDLGSDPDPLAALRRWLHALVALVATKRGMLVALAPAPGSATELYADSWQKLTSAAGLLMTRAVTAGRIRSGVAPEDLMRALMGMCYARDEPDWQRPVGRLVDIFIDGLAARRADEDHAGG